MYLKNKDNKIELFRHGELVFAPIDSLPDLTQTKTNVITKGSHGHNHTFSGGKFYKKENEQVLGYFVAKNTKLYHIEHGDKKVGGLKECKLPNGIYEIRKGQEWVNGELKQIID